MGILTILCLVPLIGSAVVAFVPTTPTRSKQLALLVSVLTLPIVAWITRNLGKSARKASTRGMVETEGLSTALAEMLDGRRIVRAYGLEDHAIARVVSGIDERARFLIKAIRSSAISAPAADLVGGIALST